MNPDEQILDKPEEENVPYRHLKSRVPRDLMVVLGAILTLCGLFSLYVFADSIDRLMTYYFQGNSYYFVRNLIACLLPFLYGFILVIAGIGLILKRVIGWIFALSAVIFPILVISIGIIRSFFNRNSFWTEFTWIIILVMLICGLFITFLLSKPIRNYFNPSRREYGIAVLIALILMVYVLVRPFLF